MSAPSRLEGLLQRVANGTTTAADARDLRALVADLFVVAGDFLLVSGCSCRRCEALRRVRAWRGDRGPPDDS